MSIQHTRSYIVAQAALVRVVFASQLFLCACGLAELNGLSDGNKGGAGGSTTQATTQGTAGDIVAGGSDPTGGAGGGNDDGAVPDDPDGASSSDGCASGSCDPCSPGSPCATTGLHLYWSLDETTGATAMDVSGNHLNGTYFGAMGVPTPAQGNVPASMASWDTTSLSFQGSTYRQALWVQATTAPNFLQLKIANDMTIAVWYRMNVTDLDSSGSELVSLGDHYILRVSKSTTLYQLEFNKHVAINGTSNVYCQCHFPVPITAGTPVFLDGNWHHLAATSTKTSPGTTLYFDGTPLPCTFNSGGDLYATSDIIYDGLGQDFWVARHGNLKDTYDFQGNLDEVRIYNRPLSGDEIKALAQGMKP